MTDDAFGEAMAAEIVRLGDQQAQALDEKARLEANIASTRMASLRVGLERQLAEVNARVERIRAAIVEAKHGRVTYDPFAMDQMLDHDRFALVGEALRRGAARRA
jgi:hypothetical protein